MKLSSASRPLFAALLLGALLGVASAEAKPEKGKAFDDWAIDCEQPPGAKEPKCFAVQYAMAQRKDGGSERVMKFTVGHLGPKGEIMTVAILPLGISLRVGAAFKIDELPQVPMAVQHCIQEGCVAIATISGANLKAMETGKTMAVGIMPMGVSDTVNIPISLKGFKAAFASLD